MRPSAINAISQDDIGNYIVRRDAAVAFILTLGVPIIAVAGSLIS